MSIRLLPVAVLMLALPALVGAGTCGVIYDIGQRQLVLEPIQRLDFDSDSGALEVYAFERNGTVVAYNLFGYDASLDDVGFELDGDVLDVFMRKGGPATVRADFYLEVPVATELTLRVAEGDVKLTGLAAPISGVVLGGAVSGVGLASAELDLEVESGAVELEFVAPIAAVVVSADGGDIRLTVPAGAYRCDLDAEDEPSLTDVTCDDAAPGELVLAAPNGAIRIEGKTP